MPPANLSLLPARRSQVAAAPTELGDVLDARQIRTLFFSDRVSVEYVLDRVAPDEKFYMGRVAVWYRGHVEAWMPLFKQEQQARAKRRRRKAS